MMIKKLFAALAFWFVAIGGFSQKIDSSKIAFFQYGNEWYVFDTIPVLLLISDTAYLPIKSDYPVSNSKVWYDWGFEVFKVGIFRDEDNPYTIIQRKHISYLNSDKKPLKHTIVVWDSKPIKK
jgi:hypothetical protein